MEAADMVAVEAQARALANAAVKNSGGGSSDPWSGIDVAIGNDGHKIILPSKPVNMDLGTAIKTLERKLKEENQEVGVDERVDAFPLDGAVAFHKAMQQMFGWVTAVPTPGFFGPQPPRTIDVEIGFNQRISVIWGRFELPGIDGHVECGGYSTPNGPRFIITGKVRRKHHKIIRLLAETTRAIVARDSIYRGKAIRLTVNDDGDVDWDNGISFSDLSGVHPDHLVFSAATEIQIATSLWTPIEQTERCRLHGIPLKRGILMEGPYGTGKSLASAVTAVKAVANRWTFLSVDKVTGLAEALHFARKYQPCVIFAEDIDRVMNGSDRDDEIDDILNTIDGIESKSTEIMVVLTTNHVERITRAMLRPGRLDAIISIQPPDAEAVRKLVRLYGHGLVKPDDRLEAAGEALAGAIPAVISECVQRAKLVAIRRRPTDDGLLITDADIADAALGLQPHVTLLGSEVEGKREPTFREIIGEALATTVKPLVEHQISTSERVYHVNGRVQRVQKTLEQLASDDEGSLMAAIKELSEKLSARRAA
jgi:transitional endoplasmic reticulum ATPase